LKTALSDLKHNGCVAADFGVDQNFFLLASQSAATAADNQNNNTATQQRLTTALRRHNNNTTNHRITLKLERTRLTNRFVH
jgi:hypothetical protein